MSGRARQMGRGAFPDVERPNVDPRAGRGNESPALTELALRQDQLRVVETVITDGICDWNLLTNEMRLSPRFKAMFGYADHELSNTPEDWKSIIHPEDRAKVERALAEHFERGKPFDLPVRYCHRNGSIVWVICRGVALQDEEGRFVRMVGTHTDITELMRAKEALEESEARFRELAESMTDVFWRLEVEEYRISYVSPSYERVWGRKREDIYRNPDDWSDAIVDEDRKRVATGYTQRIAEGCPDTWIDEYRIERPDGSVLWIRDRGFPVRDGNGKLLRLCGIAEDVTEQKRAAEERQRLEIEARIQHTQKLESLGLLAGGIAHDFNNILVGVMGNAGLALMELPESSPARKRLKDIELAAQQAADLCRQMLAYSGKGRFVVRPASLSLVVEEMRDLLKVSTDKNVVLRFDLATDLPAIAADVSQLRQIIMNLVTNGSDAIGKNPGVVTITTGVMRCELDFFEGCQFAETPRRGDYVFIEVSDTGSGMDAGTLSRIFDPFFTTKFTGRGLGLAAVHGILRGHKGALKASSQVGRGSTFKVLFPATTVSIASPPGSFKRYAPRAGNETVLVVDDDPMVRKLTESLLESAGYEALSAADGREAIEVFRAHSKRIRLVILDLTMPEMGGKEAFSELQRMNPDVRVVATSGYDEQETLANFVGKGLVGFIQKPWHPQDFLGKVSELLSEDRPEEAPGEA